jgi:hypothetical protein
MEELMGAVGGISVIVVIAWIIRQVVTSRRQVKLAQMHAELQNKLIDRFDTAEALQTFLDSEGGREIVQSVPIERSSPHGRILGSIQAGVTLTLAGLALFLIRNHAPGNSGEDFAMMFLGSLGIAIGAGFLISAAASFYLSKTWGLINGHHEA